MSVFTTNWLKSKMVWLFFAVLALSIGFSLTILLNNFFMSRIWVSYALMIPFGILLLLPPLAAIFRKKFNPFEPIYLWIILYAYLYWAKPLVLLLRGGAFYTGAAFVNQALLIAMLGLICFYCGYYLSWGKKISELVPALSGDLSSGRLYYIAIAFTIIGFLAFNYLIEISGGWRIFWSMAHGAAGQPQKTTAYIYQLSELMLVGFILAVESFMHSRIIEKARVRALEVVAMVITSLGTIGYAIAWGSRTFFAWIFVALVVLYFVKKRGFPKIKTIAVLLLALFLLILFIPMYRSEFYLGGNLEKVGRYLNYRHFLDASFDYQDEFGAYLSEVALVPRSIPYNYFQLYAQMPLYPIPRLIWHDKPTNFNPHWDEFLSKSGIQWGAAESFLGDLYAQLGVLGVMIGALFSGVIWKTIYEYFNKNQQNRSLLFLYALTLPDIFPYLAQSSFIGFLKLFPYKLPPGILALILGRTKGASILDSK